MAPKVKKSAKINFYKFVSIVKVDSKSEDADFVKVQNATIKAHNNLGITLNSLSSALLEFRDGQLKLLESLVDSSPKKFVAKFNTAKKADPLEREEEEQGSSNEAPSWLESIFNLIKDFIALAIVGPALAWLSDPENRQSIIDTLDTIGKIFEIIGSFVTDRVKGAIDGLYDFFKEDATWWERLTGFLKGFGNFALLMIGLRWITNPVKMVKDIGKVINTFWKVLKALGTGLTKRGLGKGKLPGGKPRGGKPGRGGRRGGLLKGLITTAAVATTAVVVTNSLSNSGEKTEDKPEKKPEEKAKGGKLKQRAGGGFINGPQSGYPVSMDGGQSTAFIGHGLEYVAQKASGGFVVPINTPATKNNPGLMGSRMVEASRMGYNLGGMTKGFDGGGKFAENADTALRREKGGKDRKSISDKLVKGFASGGQMSKLDFDKVGQKYRHPGGNFARDGTCTTGVLNTAEKHGVNFGNRKDYVTTSRDPNNPRGLMSQVIKKYGWGPLPGVGKTRSIRSPYGNVTSNSLSWKQWGKAVTTNKVPTGALVFSTSKGWDYSGGSSGNDSAIAQKGGKKLWSGYYQYDYAQDGKPFGGVYGPATKEVSVLVHPKGTKSRGGSNDDSDGGTEMSLTGRAKQLVGNDKAFLKEVKKVASKVGVHPADLLGLMASESGLNPQAQNKSGATGLIQFMPATAAGLGTSTAALKQMDRVEQMKYVEKFLLKTVPKGASPGHLYTAVYLPAFAKKDSNYVLAKKGGFTDSWGNHPASWYTHNKGLDANNDGNITISELGARIQKKKKEFGINGGGSNSSYTGDDSDGSNDDGTTTDESSVSAGAGQVTNPMAALSSLQSGLLSAFGMDASSSSPPKPKTGQTPAKASTSKPAKASSSGGGSSASPSDGSAASPTGGTSSPQSNESKTTGQGQDKLGPGHMRPGDGAGVPGAGAVGDSLSDTKAGSTSSASPVGSTAGASSASGTSSSVPPAASTSGGSAASPISPSAISSANKTSSPIPPGAVSSTNNTNSNSIISQTSTVLKAKQNRQKQLNQNLVSVASVAAQQNQRVQALAAQSANSGQVAPKKAKPKVISSGGGNSRDLVSQLNSSNNPMRSNF